MRLNADLFQPEEVDRFGDPKEARKKAMDYLARREYGHDELIAKLATAGFNADVAADVVSVLRSEGLQSDQRFSESFVQSRINQGKGPVRIRQELKERGIRPEISRCPGECGCRLVRHALEIRARNLDPSLPRISKRKPVKCASSSIGASTRITFRRLSPLMVNPSSSL